MESNKLDFKEQVFTTMFAPDGSWQPIGTGENMAESIGIIELLASHKVGQSFVELTNKGFKILPVKITLEVVGTEEDAFQLLKQSL